MKKNTIFFIGQLPPPVHGASSMNKLFVESPLVNSAFDMQLLPLMFVTNMNTIGKATAGKLIKMFRYAFQIVKHLFTHKPDIVYFTLTLKGVTFYRDAVYLAILKLFNSSIVYHIHVKGIQEEMQKSFFKKIGYKFAFRNTNIICLSEGLALEMETLFNIKPFIVNNGIPVTSFDPEKRKSIKKINAPNILFLSNLMRSKGVFELLEALYLVNKGGNDFFAKIIGNPGDVSIPELENAVKKYNLAGKITIHTALHGQDKYDEFISADLFVHPTLDDAFPLVLLEAMQFQLPIISTVEGAIPDMIKEGETGYLVKKKDIRTLADRIESLLKNESLRLDMGKKGRQIFLSNYTSEIFEMNMKNALTKIVHMKK